MGDVALTYRVLPETSEMDLGALQSAIQQGLPGDAKIAGIEEKPFAFGLKALIYKIIVPDAEGGLDAVENALNAVEGVQGVELLDMGRLM